MTKFEPVAPVLVISTHLDDAVLSCARFMKANPRTTVMTVLAGAPDELHRGYNSKTTGESHASDAIAKRREEDEKALSLLGADHVWLDFYDNDYLGDHRSAGDKQKIRDAIDRVVAERMPGSVLSPLGLNHVDHLAVSDACLELAPNAVCSWYLYLDMPYGLAIPRAVEQRIEVVGSRMAVQTLEPFEGDPDIKLLAMKQYSSQYGATKRSHRRGFRAAMKSAEQYWKVSGPR